MVACDVTRNAGLPQLYSDLAGLEFALCLIDYSDCERLFGKDPQPGAKRPRSRPPYPRIPLVKAYLAAYVIGIVGRQGMVSALNNNPAPQCCRLAPRSQGAPSLNDFPRFRQTGSQPVGFALYACRIGELRPRVAPRLRQGARHRLDRSSCLLQSAERKDAGPRSRVG